MLMLMLMRMPRFSKDPPTFSQFPINTEAAFWKHCPMYLSWEFKKIAENYLKSRQKP